MTPPAPEYATSAPEQKEIRADGKEIERAARQVEAAQSQRPGCPGGSRHEERGEHQEAAENRDHENPVQQLQRSLDAASNRQDGNAQQECPDADEVDQVRVRPQRRAGG